MKIKIRAVATAAALGVSLAACGTGHASQPQEVAVAKCHAAAGETVGMQLRAYNDMKNVVSYQVRLYWFTASGKLVQSIMLALDPVEPGKTVTTTTYVGTIPVPQGSGQGRCEVKVVGAS